jgi:metal-responsive CopG/Arc/MetJ family transcriptional regulator
VQVNLSSELTEKVDDLARKMGVSRSAYCAMLIGNSLDSYDKAYDIIKSMKGDLIEALKKTEVENK